VPYYASTGSSSVLYQAATWGRAIIASDLDEICKLARESNLHVEFFRTGDAESLFNSIQILLDSPRKRRLQAEHNYKSVLPSRPQETAKKYIQAFNRAFEKRNNPKRIFHSDPETG
jgi:hypothetical protein